MIKNLNDFVSAFVLLIIAFASIRLFIWAFIPSEDSNDVSKWQLIKDYINNEEE